MRGPSVSYRTPSKPSDVALRIDSRWARVPRSCASTSSRRAISRVSTVCVRTRNQLTMPPATPALARPSSAKPGTGVPGTWYAATKSGGVSVAVSEKSNISVGSVARLQTAKIRIVGGIAKSSVRPFATASQTCSTMGGD